MFTELQNQVWSVSASGVVVTNNTDTSIDGSSKKIVWSELSKVAVVSFTEVDLSQWEEISLHIFVKDTLFEDLFTMTIGTDVFTFTKADFKRGQWNHILIDCSQMSTVSSITFTNSIQYLTIFVDYIGYRKVTYNCDIDIITALKNHINLDYDVTLSLSDDASSGDTTISLNDSNVAGYITDTSVLEIDNGAGTIETVQLVTKDGELDSALTNSFSEDDEVRVICPVRSEDYDELEPDPICGVKVFEIQANKQNTIQKTKNGSKTKQYLGTLGILIYIDCRSKKKLLQMSREYNRKYGSEFQFLLDGEQVEIYMDGTGIFSDDIIGNNPRMAYYYRLEPQPYLYANNHYQITDFTLTTEVKVLEDI